MRGRSESGSMLRGSWWVLVGSAGFGWLYVKNVNVGFFPFVWKVDYICVYQTTAGRWWWVSNTRFGGRIRRIIRFGSFSSGL